MTDDIVERLREEGFITHMARLPRESKILHAAADEIERLRLEMSIPRDEYAMTWKNLLDRIDGLDIVEWIRAYANAYSPSDYSSPIAREVVVRSDAKWMQAAAEIERLRAERDEARRDRCMARAVIRWDLEHPNSPQRTETTIILLAWQIADEEGWDCFEGMKR